MGVSATTIKQELSRNLAKTLVLVVLAGVMVFFGVRAFVQMRPRTAKAEMLVSLPGEATAGLPSEMSEDAAEKLTESRSLWSTLHEKRGTAPEQAFTFAADCFPQEIVHERLAETPAASVSAPTVPQVDMAAVATARDGAIRAQGNAIIVKSIVFSGGKPMAVIDDRILTVGNSVGGFELTAIHPHDVELKKSGVTVSVKLFTDRLH